MEIRIYSPEPALKRPKQFFREMGSDLKGSFGLAYQLALRDFRALYRQSALGYFWAFLPPLVTTGLFLFLRSGKAFSTTQDTLPYLPFVLLGTLLWQTFADAVQGPLKTVTTSRAMITKINFPQEAMLLAGAGLTIINFFIRLAILVPALIYFYFKYPEVSLSVNFLFFPFSVLALMLVGYTFGVLLTPLGMLFKDIQRGLMLLLTFWMFVTPVVFPLANEGFAGVLQLINPVTPILVSARELALSLPLSMAGHSLAVVGCFSLFLFLGMVLYRIAIPHVLSRLGM